MAGQVDDGELRRVGAWKQRDIAKQKIEKGCVLVLYGDWITNQYSNMHGLKGCNNTIISGY